MVANGQIDLRQLEQIAPNRYVSPGCAAAWRGFSAAMGGLTVGNAADSCYRSLAWQQYRWAHQPPRAARPGTSNHGWGQAIDIGNYYRFSHTTLVRVGRQYGFVFDTASEPWHIKYVGAPNYYPLAASGSATLITIGTDVSTLYCKASTIALGTGKRLYALAGDSPGTPANWLETSSDTLAGQWAKKCNGSRADVNDATWADYKIRYQAPLSVKTL